MKNKQNALCAGVAALALLAGTGLALSQDHQDRGNAATKAAPSAAQTPSASPAAPSAAPAQPQASQGAGPGPQAQKAGKGNTSKPQGAAAALGRRRQDWPCTIAREVTTRRRRTLARRPTIEAARV